MKPFDSAFIEAGELLVRKLVEKSAMNTELEWQLTFTRSLQALSAVCPPNPNGSLASGTAKGEAPKFLGP